MKILVFSDIHVHTWKSFGFDLNLNMPKRLADQVRVLEQIKSYIMANKVGLVVFGGDLAHKVGEIPVECINIVSEFFKWLVNNGISYILVDGNHDLVDRDKPEWFESALNLFKYAPTDFGVKIKAINYQDSEDESWYGNDLVVAHKQPTLVNEYGHKFDGVDWKKLADNNKFVVFGHYHHHKVLDTNCFIVGSTLALTFDDKDQRGFYIFDTDGVKTDLKGDYELINDWAVSFVPTKYPKFITVNTAEEVVDDGNYYRVLNATKRIDNENVLTVVQPRVFEERIKSSDFNSILREWLLLNDKKESELESIKDLISEKFNLAKTFFKGKLDEVNINNFMSMGDIHFNVETGFNLVSGSNLDGLSSNGSGKSSLFEAVFWCLFGETTKGLTGKSVVRRGEKDCEVFVILNCGDFYYKVSRGWKAGLSVTRYSADGIPVDLTGDMREEDKQKVLEDSILGFDKNVYMASCYFSQENLTVLTGLSDVDKTSMITSLLGFEVYDDLYAKVFEKLKTTKANSEAKFIKVQSIKDKIAFVNTNISSVDGYIREDEAKLKISESELEELKFKVSELEIQISKVGVLPVLVDYDTEIKKIKSELSAIVDAKEAEFRLSMADIDSRYSKLENEIISENPEVKALKEKIESNKVLVASIKEETKLLNPQIIKSEIDKNNSKLEYINSNIASLESQILALKSSKFGERCDKCGSLITEDNIGIFISQKEEKITELRLEYDAIVAKIPELVSKLEEIKVAIENNSKSIEAHLGGIEECNIAISKLEKESSSRLMEIKSRKYSEIDGIKELRNKRVAEASSECREKEDKLTKLKYAQEDEVNRIKSAQRELESKLNLQKSALSKAIYNVTTSKETLEKKKLDLENLEHQLEALKGESDSNAIELEASYSLIASLEFWQKSFSSSGIRALLLDGFCNGFNALVNDYLSTASGGTMSVVVTPTKTTKGGDSRNKLGLEINLNDSIVEYNSLSGGEKRRIDFAVSLALNAWVSNKYLVNGGLLGVVIFDELFGSIDRAGEEAIATLLYQESRSRAIYVISHTADLSSYAERTLVVVKEYGVSRLAIETKV